MMSHIFNDEPFLGISESTISVSSNVRLVFYKQELKLNRPNKF
jgi:hypothetical protein